MFSILRTPTPSQLLTGKLTTDMTTASAADAAPNES